MPFRRVYMMSINMFHNWLFWRCMLRFKWQNVIISGLFRNKYFTNHIISILIDSQQIRGFFQELNCKNHLYHTGLNSSCYISYFLTLTMSDIYLKTRFACIKACIEMDYKGILITKLSLCCIRWMYMYGILNHGDQNNFISFIQICSFSDLNRTLLSVAYIVYINFPNVQPCIACYFLKLILLFPQNRRIIV